MADKTLSVRETAQALGVGLRHVLTLIYENKLPGAFKVGMTWRVPQGSIEGRKKSKRGTR